MSPTPSPSPDFEPYHWDTTVITLVGIVCTIFVLFSYYGILHRHCCIPAPGNPSQRRHLDEENHDDLSLQVQSQGLDYYVMHSLPITQFKKKNSQELCRSNMECAVCLGEFEEDEWLKHLPNCSHVFHVSCIDTWFQTHSSCPLCRAQLHDLILEGECSVSAYSLIETLRREDFYHERSEHYQTLRSQILHNSSVRID